MNDGTVQLEQQSGSRGIFSGYLGVDFDGDGRVNSDDEAPSMALLQRWAWCILHPCLPNASEPTWLIDGKADCSR